MNGKNVMTDNDTRQLDIRMKRLEQSHEEMRAEMRAGFDTLNRALLGSLDGDGGMLGRLRLVEDRTMRHQEALEEQERRVRRLEDEWAALRNKAIGIGIAAGVGSGSVVGIASAILRALGG